MTFDQIMRMQEHVQCPECNRTFNLSDSRDAKEFHDGHVCH